MDTYVDALQLNNERFDWVGYFYIKEFSPVDTFQFIFLGIYT